MNSIILNKFVGLILLLLHIFFIPSLCVYAQEWKIDADRLEQSSKNNTIIASGSVILTNQKKMKPTDSVSKPILIKAEKVIYYKNSNRVSARGHIIIDRTDSKIKSESGEFDLEQDTGKFVNASVSKKTNDFYMEGAIIEKTGKESYHVKDGWFITCKPEQNEKPPWSLASKDTAITDGGYAILKDATFRVKDVPIFYTPYLIVPAKKTRQSGLLFPEVSNSDLNGLGVNMPLFVNISDSMDMTVYNGYHENRGMMPGLEFRYMRDNLSRGMFMVNYLNDSLDYDEAYKEEYRHTQTERYWLRGKANQKLADGWKMTLDVDVVSDEDFLREFDNGSMGFAETNNRFKKTYNRGFQEKSIKQRNNSLILSKSWQQAFMRAEMLAVNDVSYDKTGESSLWKLPHLQVSGFKTLENTSLVLDWEADYTYFYRENGKGGHRIDLRPKFKTPVNVNQYLDTRVSLGGRKTFYLLDDRGDENLKWNGDNYRRRFLYDVNAKTSTVLTRNFQYDEGKKIISHELRPYVEYNFIPDEEGVLDGEKFDDIDIIASRDRFTYGINNFFFSKMVDTNVTSRALGNIKVSQSYLRNGDHDRTSEEKMSNIYFDLKWTPNNQLYLRYQTELDVYGNGISSYALDGTYFNKRGDSIALDYQYKRREEIHQINGKAKIRLTDTVFTSYQTKYSLNDSQAIEHNLALVYQQPCWSVALESSYKPGDTTVMLVFKLANIGSPLGLNLPDF